MCIFAISCLTAGHVSPSSMDWQPDWQPAGSDRREDGRPPPTHERDRQRHEGDQDVHVGGRLLHPRPGHQEVR